MLAFSPSFCRQFIVLQRVSLCIGISSALHVYAFSNMDCVLLFNVFFKFEWHFRKILGSDCMKQAFHYTQTIISYIFVADVCIWVPYFFGTKMIKKRIVKSG